MLFIVILWILQTLAIMLFCYSTIHNNIMDSIDPCYYAILLFIVILWLLQTLAILLFCYFSIPLHAGPCYYAICFTILIIVTSPYTCSKMLVAFFTRIPCYCVLAGIYDSYRPNNGNIKIEEEQGSVERSDDSRIAIIQQVGVRRSDQQNRKIARVLKVEV